MIDASEFRHKQRIIFIVGDEGDVIVPHNIPDAAPFFAASDNTAAAKEVMDFIEGHPQARITLFADNLAQDYREDDLPPLSFFDRPKLIRRRLQQKFRSARLTASLRFRRTPGRFLMIGLHEPSPLFMWAERLRHRLPDIALLPVEGARLLSQLMPEARSGWAMLISRQRTEGIRQIVTYKGDLVFTRLTTASSSESGGSIALAVKATVDYLSRLGLQRAEEMSVLVLAKREAFAEGALEALCFKDVRYVSPADAAGRLALPFSPGADEVSADILFAAHLLSSFRPRVSLMLPEARAEWRELQTRRWGTRVACGCLAASVLVTLWRAGDLASILYKSQREAFELSQTQRELAEIKQKAGPLTEPLGLMRQALERRRIFDAPQVRPWHVLNELSGGLDWSSKIAKLEWKVENGAESLAVTLRLSDDPDSEDRADKVARFSILAQTLSSAMPDFRLASIRPPYPSLPNETVSGEARASEKPEGQVFFERQMQ